MGGLGKRSLKSSLLKFTLNKRHLHAAPCNRIEDSQCNACRVNLKPPAGKLGTVCFHRFPTNVQLDSRAVRHYCLQISSLIDCCCKWQGFASCFKMYAAAVSISQATTKAFAAGNCTRVFCVTNGNTDHYTYYSGIEMKTLLSSLTLNFDWVCVAVITCILQQCAPEPHRPSTLVG